MSYDNFIPTIWSAEVQRNLEKRLVYGNVANRNYEGEVANQGDTVKINQIGAVTVSSYTKNSTTVTPEVLDDASQTMSIDQANYFAFKVDDVDAAQTKGAIMEAAMAEAAYQMADTIDQYIAALYTQGGITGGSSNEALGTSASEVTVDNDGTNPNPFEYLGRVRRRLKDGNVPGPYWIILPPWMTQLMVDKATGLSISDVNGMLTQGELETQIQGFTVFESTNVSTDDTEYRIMAGNASSITLAMQINKVEAFRQETSFSDAVKGLHLYGSKIVRPDTLAVGVIKE